MTIPSNGGEDQRRDSHRNRNQSLGTHAMPVWVCLPACLKQPLHNHHVAAVSCTCERTLASQSAQSMSTPVDAARKLATRRVLGHENHCTSYSQWLSEETGTKNMFSSAMKKVGCHRLRHQLPTTNAQSPGGRVRKHQQTPNQPFPAV